MSSHPPSFAGVRACLLGHGGPYASARDATDPLDNLNEWIRQLEPTETATMCAALCDLLGDSDPVVRTGAALGLAALGPSVDADRVLAAVHTHSEALEVPPIGFAGAWKPTVLADAALVVAAHALPRHAGTMSEWLDRPPGGLTIDQLGAALAARLPHVLLWEPRRWFDTRHTAVLVRLPQHWQRRSFALALGPWPASAAANVRTASHVLGWADGDLDPLLEAMSGRYVPGSHPEGLVGASPASGRWWEADAVAYDWSLWRHEHGLAALEVLLPGWGMICRSRLLDDNEVATYRSVGATSLTELIEELRRA